MSSISQIPNWLTITRVGDQHYQLTDNSVESVGLCLGVFHSREAAENLAGKIARARGYSPDGFASGSRATLSLTDTEYRSSDTFIQPARQWESKFERSTEFRAGASAAARDSVIENS